MLQDRSPLPHPEPPTVRSIAGRLGLSAMSVSRALRNRPGVSDAVRARIQAEAAALGYRPDPDVVRLMHRLRARRRRVHQGLVCALTDAARGTIDGYCQAIVDGAARRLEGFGYRLQLERFGHAEADRAHLRTKLRNRGVEGLLLLPLVRTADLSALLDWSQYSVVAATSSVSAPLFHRVHTHQYANTLLLCDQLRARGSKRIGLILSAADDERSSHAHSAAVLWFNQRHLGAQLPGLVHEGPLTPAVLRSWLGRWRPDTLLFHDERSLASILERLDRRQRRRLALAHLSGSADTPKLGVNLRPLAIGEAAADLLAGLLQRRERGIPAQPSATMLPGVLVGTRITAPPGSRAA